MIRFLLSIYSVGSITNRVFGKTRVRGENRTQKASENFGTITFWYCFSFQKVGVSDYPGNFSGFFQDKSFILLSQSSLLILRVARLRRKRFHEPTEISAFPLRAGSHFDISISISRHTQTRYDDMLIISAFC